MSEVLMEMPWAEKGPQGAVATDTDPRTVRGLPKTLRRPRYVKALREHALADLKRALEAIDTGHALPMPAALIQPMPIWKRAVPIHTMRSGRACISPACCCRSRWQCLRLPS